MFPVVGYLLLFIVIGAGFILIHLLIGKLIRPDRPHEEKETIYECGEPTIGSAWIQFDLRFYVVALLFVIFDVEVAFFFPWAVVFGQSNSVAQQKTVPEEEKQAAYHGHLKELRPQHKEEGAPDEKVVQSTAADAQKLSWIAFFDILVFFGVLLVGFAYLWKRGDLAWVRSVAAERGKPSAPMRSVANEQAMLAKG